MSVTTSVIGFPRIGVQRELKKAIEGYWKGKLDLNQVRGTAQGLRADHWKLQKEAGIDLIPSNDFSYYDQMLDMAILLNAIPQPYRDLGLGPEETLFAMGRGYQGDKGDVTALPMKKWFTTNYHYLVPEIDASTRFKLAGTKPFDEFKEAEKLGIITKPVLIGPYTFLKLARGPEGERFEFSQDQLSSLTEAYKAILGTFITLGADWVQFDEPYLVLDKEEGDLDLFTSLYREILPARLKGTARLRILLQTYFGHLGDCFREINNLNFDGIGLDMVEGCDENLAALKQEGVSEETTIFAGLVNGRNIWRNNYAISLGILDAIGQVTSNIAISTASSLLHVPFTVANEDGLDPQTVRPHFAFAVEKLGELHDLSLLAVTPDDQKKSSQILADNQQLFDGSRVEADQAVADRLAALTAQDFIRKPARSERQKVQAQELGLPLLPTTTIGSFPQTAQIRAYRAQLRKGQISQEDYDAFIASQIDQVIDHQEKIGLDVLVHGEFERNDMVEYFGQNLKGYLFTKNAWVQSYGTRCVKPPIVWGDISRARPITVRWSSYAQSRTRHVVKGMLTGPVTILNWSWPREDISHQRQTEQLALAIRDEVLDLEAAGIKVIQIDEAALREKLPLRRSDWHSRYLDWAIPAFRLVHSAVQPGTQIHTHMCYSEFNDIIKDIDAMDADVISFEASRSDLTVLDAIQEAHFETEAGPGVYDIHSPRIPSQEEIVDRIHAILNKLDAKKVWINPDCGLKTRANAETWPSLEHMVAAAHQVREELSSQK